MQEKQPTLSRRPQEEFPIQPIAPTSKIGWAFDSMSNPDYASTLLDDEELKKHLIRRLDIGFLGNSAAKLAFEALYATFKDFIGKRLTGVIFTNNPWLMNSIGTQVTPRNIENAAFNKPAVLSRMVEDMLTKDSTPTASHTGEGGEPWRSAREHIQNVLKRVIQDLVEPGNNLVAEILTDALQHKMNEDGIVQMSEVSPIITLKILDKTLFGGELLKALWRVYELPEMKFETALSDDYDLYVLFAEVMVQGIDNGLNMATRVSRLWGGKGKVYATYQGRKISAEEFTEIVVRNLVAHCKQKPIDEQPPIMSYMFDKVESLQSLSEEERYTKIKAALVNTVFAGNDTTAASFKAFMRAITVGYGENGYVWQDRIREELMKHRAYLSQLSAEERQNVRYTEAYAKKHLPVLMAVIMEVLRLFAPTATLIRFAEKETVISDTKAKASYTIPEGTLVFGSFYLANRSAEVWGEDAREFNPWRFLLQQEDGAIAFTHDQETQPLFTFGVNGDPRSCVGEALAMLEMIAMAMALIDNSEYLENMLKDPDAYMASVIRATLFMVPEESTKIKVYPKKD